MRLVVAFVVVAAGCRLYSNAGIDGGDATPSQIVVTGVVTSHAAGTGAPVAGAVVAALHLDDDSLAGSVITAADGSFTLTLLPADNDVYLATSGSGFVDTLYNFPTVATSGAAAGIDLFTPAAYAQLFSDADVTQVAGTGVFEIDAYGATTVSISPPSGTVRYDNGSGIPVPTQTYPQDGRSYVLAASTGTADASFFGLGDSYSREVRVVGGEVSQVALPAPPGGD
jgi:hypothetical protein